MMANETSLVPAGERTAAYYGTRGRDNVVPPAVVTCLRAMATRLLFFLSHYRAHFLIFAVAYSRDTAMYVQRQGVDLI